MSAQGSFRWTICALVFFATTINYLDRQIFSLLVPFFENDLRLGPVDLAFLNVAFVLPYGFAMIFVGRFIDRVGLRRGLASAFVVWSAASIGHALVRSLGGFLWVRFVLGVGESGMYPAAVKAITEWFPAKERALGTGIFNAGANLGAVLAPLLGVSLALHRGWRAGFLVTGAAGLIWLVFWNYLYQPPESHPKVSDEELAYIRSDPPEPETQIGFRQLLAVPPVIGLAIAKAMTDAPWWFYLFWMPKLLVDQFHLSPGTMALAIPVIYIVADVGSVAGGWLSSSLIQRGFPIGKARKLTMLVCALAVTPVMGVGALIDHQGVLGIPAVWLAVALVSLAAGAHQGWSSNLFTLISDTTPKSSMAMAVGAINGFAMVGVSAMQLFVGKYVQLTSSYGLPFIVAGGLYLAALGVIQLFIPRVERVPPLRLAGIGSLVAGSLAVIAGLAWLQYEANRPPYASLSDYLAKRKSEFHALEAAEEGPAAQVGWMEGRWYQWRLAGGKAKLELIKLDTYGHPYVESKGAHAAQYRGPGAGQLAATFR